jgi:nucleoside-diphosphate-sugar epimerase
MPKVLIVGATGYVGQALALSLIHSGNHIVYGLARSNQKARALAQQEILPVLCADFAKDPTALSRAIEHEYALGSRSNAVKKS